MKKMNGILVAIVAVTVVLMADPSGAAAKNLPAGGDVIAVIGVVFLVLLILELVGVTNVFNRV